jgi:hypothetical protein
VFVGGSAASVLSGLDVIRFEAKKEKALQGLRKSTLALLLPWLEHVTKYQAVERHEE